MIMNEEYTFSQSKYHIPSAASDDPYRTEFCKSVNCIYIDDDNIRKAREPLSESEHEAYLSIISEEDFIEYTEYEAQGVEDNEHDFNTHMVFNINASVDPDDYTQ